MPQARPKLAKPLEGSHPRYPYENIVLQGGGAKGIIYGGAILALAELGILPYIKRVAAASAGCAPGLMVALGLDAEQLVAETNKIDLHEFFDGAKNVPCGKAIALGFNAFHHLGMHPAEKVLSHFGDMLERYTGNADLTFLDLYHQCGRELCISVSNVSRAQTEFCHVNTTPDMPIRNAIRASMSLPILWEPVQLAEGELYVDGGLFNNFPIKAFDGWFLSTDRASASIVGRTLQDNPGLSLDSTRHNLMKAYKKTMSASFVKPNMATLGFRVSSYDSPDEAAYATYLSDLEGRLEQTHREGGSERDLVGRCTQEDIKYPDTELANAFLEKQMKETELIEGSLEFETAYVAMTSWSYKNMSKMPPSKKHPLGVETAGLVKALEENPPDFSFTLFGFNSWKEFGGAFDTQSKGYVIRTDISMFWDKYSVHHPFMKNRKAKKIDTLGGLAGELINSLYNVAEETMLRDPNNAKRICILTTKYIGLLDLKMEQGDRDFLFEIGKKQTIAWIKDRKRQEVGSTISEE